MPVIAWYPCYHVDVIRSFRDKATEDLFHGTNSPAARRACPRTLWALVARKLDMLDSVAGVADLKVPPGNRLEKLTGDRSGQWSIRINDQYRICFEWGENGPREVEVTDYH